LKVGMNKPATRSVELGLYRVDFIPSGDRIAHVIYVRAPGTENSAERPWIVLLRSVESAADVAWPDSPPLQELHVEDRGGVPVALLVGRAGKSHWSASLGCEGAESGEQRLVIDVACRVSTQPVLLGSGYAFADGVRWLGRTPHGGNDHARWQSISLIAREAANWQLAVEAPSSLVAFANADQCRVEPQAGNQNMPATFRWRIQLTTSIE
jgi:hypothetical protein